MTSAPQPRFFTARPTIRVDGELQPALGEEYLKTLLVEETTLGLFRCEASFGNWGPRDDHEGLVFFEQGPLNFGKFFTVDFGPPGNISPVFAGRISGIEARYYSGARPPEITVLAEDRFQDLRMQRRTRSFENISDAAVVRQIATDHSLTAKLVDIEGPTYRTLTQVNQSDLAFLRERMAAIDAVLWIDGSDLYAQMRSRRNAGRVTFTYKDNLLEFSALADLAHQRTAVHVCGWDIGGKRAIDESADEAVIASELAGGRSGSTILGQAFAARHERIVSAVPLSQDEARRMAEARYRERARRFVRGTGTVAGDVKIRVGATIELRGLGPLFDGSYFVTLARHTFEEQNGFRTTFEVERPAIGP